MSTETPDNELQDDSNLDESTAESGSEEASEQMPPTDPLTLAESERDQFRDQFLRTAAELENFRKRAAREREEMFKYASFGLIAELLPALDNLKRAIDAASEEEANAGILQGVQMVLKQFEEILSRHGAEPIVAEGQPFDPNFHEALQQTPTSDVPPMTVVQEFEKGFKLHDRVIRPSKVIVSKEPTEETESGE